MDDFKSAVTKRLGEDAVTISGLTSKVDDILDHLTAPSDGSLTVEQVKAQNAELADQIRTLNVQIEDVLHATARDVEGMAGAE